VLLVLTAFNNILQTRSWLLLCLLRPFIFLRRATPTCLVIDRRCLQFSEESRGMSHAAVPEDVPHHYNPLHHPNHRHAIPSRPILLRRATTSHLGRQPPGRPQGAPFSPLHRPPAAYPVQNFHQPVFDCQCGEIPIPQGGAMIDIPVLSLRFLRLESGYGSLTARVRMMTRTHTYAAGLTPRASGSAQQSTRETS
jgi:hypothetical protein